MILVAIMSGISVLVLAGVWLRFGFRNALILLPLLVTLVLFVAVTYFGALWFAQQHDHHRAAGHPATSKSFGS